MISQLTKIAKFLSGKNEGYACLIRNLLPIIKKLLLDTNARVVNSAAEALANIAEIIKPEHRGEYILTIALGIYRLIHRKT